MTPAPPGDWQRTSPFAILYFVGTVTRLLARSLLQALVPLAAVFLVARDEPINLAWLVPFVGLAVLLAVGVAVLQWACFKFRIGQDRLLIRKGVLKKTALDLPYERVQGINVERSLVDRVIGLVTVTLDTSGSVQAEGKLPSIRGELADHLRAGVASVRPASEEDGLVGETGTGEPVALDPSDAAATSVGPPHRGRVLLRLGAGDMVRIGLANRNFIFVAAFVGVMTDLLQPGDLIDPVLEAISAGVDSAASAFSALGALAQVVVVAIVVLAVAGTTLLLLVTAAFLRHYNFTLWHDGTTFRSRAGLLTQREVVVQGRKIQQLTITQDLLLRWFGRFRLRAPPASAAVPQGNESSIGIDLAQVLDVPLLEGRSAEEVRSRVFGREARGVPVLPGGGAFSRVSPHYIRALTLRICLVSALMAGAFALAFGGLLVATATVLIWWLASLPLAVLIAWQVWRRRAFAHDDDGLASRSGFLGRKVEAFLMRKAQSVAVKRSPLQRRKGLATLRVQLACGAVTVPYIDERVARRLRDYILYRVESSRRRWH